MIRTWLRRCKRTLLRHLGFYDLYNQTTAAAGKTETSLQLLGATASSLELLESKTASLLSQLESEIASLRQLQLETAASLARLTAAHHDVNESIARSIAAQNESITAQNASITAQNASMMRFLEAEAAARQDHVQRVVWELEQRLRSQLASDASQAGLNLQSQSESTRDTIDRHFEIIRSWDLDRWRIREDEGLLRYFRRKDYLRAIRNGDLLVPRLETEHPVAISSNDTKFPRGCKNDNSIAPRFNRKLYQFLDGRSRLRVLDVGCAGGGFVRSLIDDGHFAVGLEGSDYPLTNQSGEWSTIPLHLFTCDVTHPFQLIDDATGEPLRFDAVTAWEVMEHIPEEGLGCLLENLDRHLAPNGYLLFSIATFLDWDQQTGTIWHVTIKPPEWWEEQFARHGFAIEREHPFGQDDWLRGSGQCRGDWHESDGMGFHVVLRRRTAGEMRRGTSDAA